jgi:hypothetical protein
VPFRALSLLSVETPSSGPGINRDSGDPTTRRDTVTSIPGSVVERRSSPSAYSWLPSGSVNTWFLGRQLNLATEFSKMRARAISGSVLKFRDVLRPTMVDLVRRDLSSPVKGEDALKVRDLRRLDRKVESKILPIVGRHRMLAKVPTLSVTGGIVVSVRIVNHRFSIRQWAKADWLKAFNKNCKAFGPVSRNRSFRFLLKLVTFFGLNQRDFRNLLRVRELYLRGSRKFRGAVIGLITSYPNDFRSFVNSLPRKRKFRDPRHSED